MDRQLTMLQQPKAPNKRIWVKRFISDPAFALHIAKIALATSLIRLHTEDTWGITIGRDNKKPYLIGQFLEDHVAKTRLGVVCDVLSLVPQSPGFTSLVANRLEREKEKERRTKEESKGRLK